MKKNKRIILTIIYVWIALISIHAQETFVSTGGNATGNGGSSAYSLGQVIYTKNTGTNGSVIQGIQQPYEISIVSGIEETTGISLECSVFPNPTTDFLILKIEGVIPSLCIMSLYDNNGKILKNKTIESNESTFDMSKLLPATYILKLYENPNSTSQKEIKTFKIIKY